MGETFVALEASRQYVTLGAGKGQKGSFVLFFLARLGEILALGVENIHIFLWMTRWKNVLSHREQANGLSPVWIVDTLLRM